MLEGKDGFFCVLNGDSETGESFRQLLSGERDRMKEILAEEEKIFCNCYLSESGQSLEAVHKGYEEVRLKFVNKEIQDKTEENEICSIDRIMEIIRKNLSAENLSVNGIAEQVGVTPSHLSRYFKHQMGTGVLEYPSESCGAGQRYAEKFPGGQDPGCGGKERFLQHHDLYPGVQKV